MTKHILKYILLDILKNKLVVVYTLVLATISWSVFGLEDNSDKGVMSLLNLVLLILPLFSIIFANIYMYNSTEFIELLLSHPIDRRSIWWAFFIGLSLSLTIALLIGVGIPVLIFSPLPTAITLLSAGIFLSLIFVSIAMLTFVLTQDKAKGIGLSIVFWLFLTFIYDGIMIMLMFQLSDYPIEKGLIGLTSINPIDLSRIMILLQLDSSAIMGFTGALFKEFFGSVMGMAASAVLLLLWIAIPFYISSKRFYQKDL